MVKHGTLKAGEYRFDHPASVFTVYDRLRRGDVYYRVVTIPEGYNLFDIATAVEAAQLATRDDFLTAAHKDTALVIDLDPRRRVWRDICIRTPIDSSAAILR